MTELRCPYCNSLNIHLVPIPVLPDLRQAASCNNCGLLFIKGRKINAVKHYNDGHGHPKHEKHLAEPHPKHEKHFTETVKCPFCLGQGSLTRERFQQLMNAKGVKADG